MYIAILEVNFGSIDEKITMWYDPPVAHGTSNKAVAGRGTRGQRYIGPANTSRGHCEHPCVP